MCKRFCIPLFGIAFVLLFGAVVMLLWNALLPPLLNVGVIGYWQAVGLLILARILFGGFHCGRHFGRHPFMHRRWMALSEEEREKLREEWGDRCGCGKPKPPASE
jgi:hypothetical protein